MPGLTLQQLTQMGGQPMTPSPQPTGSPNAQPNAKGLSLQQLQQMGGTPVTPSPTPANQILADTVTGTQKDYSQAIPNFVAEAGKNDQSTSKNPIVRTAENALGATASGLSTVFAPISNAIKATITAASNEKGIQSFAQNPLVSNVLDSVDQIGAKINQLAQQHPEFARNLSNALTVGTAAIGEKPTTEAATGTLETAAETAKNTASDLNPFKEKPITPEQMQSNLQGVANDWAKPTTINEPKYNNARAVLEKDPNVPQTLAQNGINPFSSIEDGKYNTEDIAQKLRDDNGKLSNDLLRPSLQKADLTTAPTPIVDLNPKIDTTYGVTADDAETIQNKLTTKLDALKRKYPNGMTLNDMLTERITYDQNGGYKAFKSNADNIDAIANRSIANSMRTTLVDKGEAAGIPVSDFQTELSKNYRAADYLDALHGKKAPVSTGQTIARYASKVVGAKAAGMLGGGDLVSEFVGYHIGGALEKFVENMTNPMRDAFLKNLKITNPKAFTQMQEYLKTTQGEGFTMKD